MNFTAEEKMQKAGTGIKEIIEERKERNEIKKNMQKLRRAVESSSFKEVQEAVEFLKSRQDKLSSKEKIEYSNLANKMICTAVRCR